MSQNVRCRKGKASSTRAASPSSRKIGPVLTDALPPHDLDAERSLLGAILVDARQLMAVRGFLIGTDFYRDAHRHIFEAAIRLAARGSAIDPVTVRYELDTCGVLAPAGGPAYLAALIDGVPRTDNAEFYARIVKQESLLRMALGTTVAVQQSVIDHNGNGAGRRFDDLARAAASLTKAVDELTTLREDAVPPLSCLDLSQPQAALPEPLVGNDREQLLMPGEAVALASDPGVGKTKLLCEIALGLATGTGAVGFQCRQQKVVLVTSEGDPQFEMNLRRQWAGRDQNVAALGALPLRISADNDFCLEEDIWYARLRRTLDHEGARQRATTLILESLASNVQETDLNNQVSVRQFVRARIRSLMATFPGLTVVISCHLRKRQMGGGNDLASRVAGSIQIRGAVDCVIGLTPAGKNAFSIRGIKRSRSGGDFESFKVQILGGRTDPLLLRNEGSVELGLDELRGAARAVMEFMSTTGGRRVELKEICAAVSGFRKRAVEGACKRLSEAEPPRLSRISKKPAAYALPPAQSDLGLEELE